MADLTVEEVAALARSVGLTLSQEDVVDVAHRLNMILYGMENISHPDLDQVDPLAFVPFDEGQNGQ
jgi:Asp-tRNA(Asn)/Glu-tRNA(Gln) amidotransferase C subunit